VKTDYLKDNLKSKFVSSETAPADVRKNAAIRKWLAVERDNEATNDRLILTPEEYNILPRVPWVAFVSWCQDFILSLIGEVPSEDVLIGAFSGGASTSRKRTKSHPASKYVGEAHVTQRASQIFEEAISLMPGWLRAQTDLSVKIVPGNVLFTVPKKTDIDRCACKEPDINMFLQKGVGDFIRRRLRTHGIDLNDQTTNQSLARVGSIDDSLSTLDLSSASDSVSTEFVRLMLPLTWFVHLDALRCEITQIGSYEHRNHMFSSMGNGFTFELESLLFYTLARAVAFFTGTRGKISIYGDDIICPRAMSYDLIHVLGYFGFSTNEEKSFVSGPVRESCGGHYYNGLDITPFFIRAPISTMMDIIHMANSLRKWAGAGSGFAILDPEVEEIWLWLSSYIPRSLKGGGDLSFKYQLVSRDTPERFISEEMATPLDVGEGGYFHWLNATWARDIPSDLKTDFHSFWGFGVSHLFEGVSTSKLSRGLNAYRTKKVQLPPDGRSAVTCLSQLWLHELNGNMPDNIKRY
jgi:hypothetical protein